MPDKDYSESEGDAMIGCLLCVTSDQRLQLYSAEEDGLVMARHLVGSNGEVTDLCFLGESQDKVALATASENIRILDSSTLQCHRTCTGHSDVVLALCTSIMDGVPLIVSGAKDRTVRVWNGLTAECIGVGEGHAAAVSAVSLSNKRTPSALNFAVSGSGDRTLKLWDLRPLKRRLEGSAHYEPIANSEPKEQTMSTLAVVAAHDKDINTVAPNDSLICTGSQDRSVKLWRAPELVSVLTLKGHKRGVWCVQFSPVDKCVVSGSGDRTIKIWALSDGTCLKTFEGPTAQRRRGWSTQTVDCVKH